MTAAGCVRRLPVRLTIALLALVLAFFGAQTAFHSVHHLADDDHRPSCPVLLASAHVHAMVTTPVELPAPAALASAPTVSMARPAATFALAAYQGRAPPTTPAA